MTEQIYIDDTLMDIEAGGGGVQMVFQSPYFTDLKSIVSNRTNSVSLPATANNLRAIGYAGTQAYTQFPYRKHDVIYKRDGIQLLKGTATLLSVQAETITMCFVWGNNTAFSPLFDVSLQELAEFGIVTERYCPYRDYSYAMRDYYSGYMSYGAGRHQPILLGRDILQRIALRFGITGVTDKAEWNYMCIPLLTHNGDTQTKNAQAFSVGGSGQITDINGAFHQDGNGRYSYKVTPIGLRSGYGQDFKNQFNASSYVINVTEASKVTIQYGFSNYTIYHYYKANVPVSEIIGLSVLLYKNDASGEVPDNAVNLLGYTLVRQDLNQAGTCWRDTMKINGSGTQEIDTDGYSYLRVVLSYGNHYVSDASEWVAPARQEFSVTTQDGIYCTMTLKEINDAEISEDVLYGIQTSGGQNVNNFPMFKNLPDISCGQFLKNLMLMTGRFAYSNKANEIQFTSLTELYTNRANAIDWTQKVLTRKGRPTEQTTTLDSVSKKNWLKYAEDEGINEGIYDAYLSCDDDNAEAETILFQSDFALAPNNNIPCWQKNDDELEFIGDSRKPRILRTIALSPQFAKNWTDFAWQRIIASKYVEYQRVILHPVVIKVSVLMNTADLQALDLTIPVYLRQTGRYYCIKQLTTKNGTEAEATLIQL